MVSISLFIWILIIVIVIGVVSWALLYYNSSWFSKNVADPLFLWFSKHLKNNLIKHLALFLVHGGLHTIILIITALLITQFFIFSCENIGPEPNKISMAFTRESDDTIQHPPINNLNIRLILNSDSLYKKSGGKGRNGIRIDYSTKTEDSLCTYLLYLEWNKRHKISALRDTSKYASVPECEIDTDIDTIASVRIKQVEKEFQKGFYVYNDQDITIINDGWGPNIDNPYYYYYLSLDLVPLWMNREAFLNDSLNYMASFEIQIGDTVKKTKISSGKNTFEMPTKSMTNKNLKYVSIYPTPDGVSNGIIRYNSEESLKKLMNLECFITLQAEDVDLIKEKDRRSLVMTVLLGMLVGFLLDVIIQQIKELRNINRLQDDVIKNPPRPKPNRPRRKRKTIKKKSQKNNADEDKKVGITETPDKNDSDNNNEQ